MAMLGRIVVVVVVGHGGRLLVPRWGVLGRGLLARHAAGECGGAGPVAEGADPKGQVSRVGQVGALLFVMSRCREKEEVE